MATDSVQPIGEKPTNRRWVIFSLASMTSWLLYLHRYTFGVIRPELEQEYGFSNTELDSIFALFNLTYAFGQIPSGIICDFFGPHIFLAIIILLWSLVLPLVGATGSVGGLGAARLTFGAAQAGCYPSLAKVTRVWFPLRSRTIVQGLIASFFGRSGGAMASIILSSFLMGLCGFSWRASLLCMSAVGVIFAFVFFKFCRNSPEDDPNVNEAELKLIRGHEETQDDAPAVLPFWRAIRNPSLVIFILQQFLNAGADMIYGLHMGSYFRNSRGVTDDVQFGLLVSLPLWGGACGGIVGGILNDTLIRWTGKRRIARTTVGFTGKFVAVFFLYGAVKSGDPTTAAWMLFATKFFSDWTQPTVWGTSTDMGGRYSATVFSIINTSGSIAGVVTPLLGGILLDAYVTETEVAGEVVKVTNYDPVFVLVGAMYWMSAMCWFFINSNHSLDRDNS